ncbi:MAG TPA: J domain-containing protein, partial [Polyangia bacterium]
VLSRVDGRMSYDEICMLSGLDREQTLEILRTLKQARLILGPGEVALGAVRKSMRSGRTPSALPAAPEAEPAPASAPPQPVVERPKAGSPAKPRADTQPSPARLGPLERLDDGSPVAAGELVDWPDGSMEVKARIVRLHRRIKQVSAFDLLGLDSGADDATLRRAFGTASKELHPDRYFGKNLGSFKSKLAAIFSRLSEAVQEIEQSRKSPIK